MTERSFPFDSGDGSTVTENDWSYLARGWQDNGVDAPGPWISDLKVVSQSEVLALRVTPGHAFLEGFHYHLDAEKVINFAQNTDPNPRIDLVVLRLDRNLNTVALAVKQGAPSSAPVTPGVDRSWSSPEIPLASFRVRGNASSVVPAEVTDVREYRGSRVRVVEDPAAMPEGALVYKASTGKFYARGKAGSSIELGASTDLTPYLTKSEAAYTYATKPDYTNYFTYSSSNGFSHVTGGIRRVGTLAVVNLIVTSSASLGSSTTVLSGFRASMLTIDHPAFHPDGTAYLSMHGWNNWGSVGAAQASIRMGHCQVEDDAIAMTVSYTSNSSSTVAQYFYHITGSYNCVG
ncbi:hypothetical protein ACFV0L_10420 [Streptosporangium canum]|uniref:hypothetical protein n=1 Tax=Streptosporangium canum TaxID=324952 RepID=UPI003684AF1D